MSSSSSILEVASSSPSAASISERNTAAGRVAQGKAIAKIRRADNLDILATVVVRARYLVGLTVFVNVGITATAQVRRELGTRLRAVSSSSASCCRTLHRTVSHQCRHAMLDVAAVTYSMYAIGHTRECTRHLRNGHEPEEASRMEAHHNCDISGRWKCG